MLDGLDAVIKDTDDLRRGYLFRNGFVFTVMGKSAVFDTLVIRCPQHADICPPKLGVSSKSLDEHIQLINQHQLEKAIVICEDLSFIVRCPSLKEISIYPFNVTTSNFDFSPLYEMPCIRRLFCNLLQSTNHRNDAIIDYSRISGIKDVSIVGNGHTGYVTSTSIERLWISRQSGLETFSDISMSGALKDVMVFQCGLQTLRGIEKHRNLQSLALHHNRSLVDISPLVGVSESLRSLSIDSCPKICDFSVLHELTNLEHLVLKGSNNLENLSFLNRMAKLKTIYFTMNVKDGNISSCMKIPYASCKNRKHYNYKDAQLPKRIDR